VVGRFSFKFRGTGVNRFNVRWPNSLILMTSDCVQNILSLTYRFKIDKAIVVTHQIPVVDYKARRDRAMGRDPDNAMCPD